MATHATSANDRSTDQPSTWYPAPAGLKGGRPSTHHHDRPRSSPRSHPPHSPRPPLLHYSALPHLWLHKWPTTSSTVTVVKRKPKGHHVALTYTIGAGDAAIGTCFAARGPAATDVVASLPRLPLPRPISPPPRCTRGSSNVIDPGRTMCTFLLPRWQVHLRAGSSRSTDCRPGRFTFGHRIWELGF